MNHAEALEPFAVKSYRYLRLAIVVVVLALMASVGIERANTTCFEGSISAYFYTPVQAVFVAALVTIGVTLIAIKGSTDVEDALLNVAGVLAPIVAFVPTSPPERPGDACSSVVRIVGDAEPYIDNNVLAFAMGGAAAIVIAYLVARAQKKPMEGFDRVARVGVAGAVVLLLAGLAWYFAGRESFLDYAHMFAAITMFVIVGVVIALNARGNRANGKPWLLYALIAGAMALSLLGVLVGKRVDPGWRHATLWLEVLELTAFAGYWLAQTLEHWHGGVPTGAERHPGARRP